MGLIPGPRDLLIHTYSPVSDLLSLWRGVTIEDEDGDRYEIRAALICTVCDLPAGRKVCGFLSFSVNYGCSRCYSKFGTGVFGKKIILVLIKLLGKLGLTPNTGKMLKKIFFEM